MKVILKNISVLSILIIVLAACNSCNNKGPDDTLAFDQEPMLVNYANNFIIPNYTTFASDVDQLKTNVSTFTQTPSSDNLTSLRNSWKTALMNWQKVSVYEFGPAADVLLRENINLYPTDTTIIASNIVNGGYDLNSVSNYSAKGFQAIDYLINGTANTDAAIVAYFSDSLNGQKRCEYLSAVTSDISEKTTQVKNNWETYSTQFTISTGTDIGSSTGLMINALNRYWEVYLRDGKIGIPSGSRSFSGTPLPEKVEAYYYGEFSTDLCLEAVKNLKQLYLGGQAEGLDNYLIHYDAKTTSGESLNDAINAQFDKIIALLEEIGDPLRTQVVDNNAKAKEIFNEMQALAIMLKVDMPAAIGTLITYSDNDGD